MSTQQITVSVPTERAAEFHIMFGQWLLQAPQTTSPVGLPQEALQAFGQADPDLVLTWWQRLSDEAREMFGFLADNPDSGFTGTELAEVLGVTSGPAGVAGVTSWPGVHAERLGLSRPWLWDGETNTYSVDAEMAAAIKTAQGSA